MKGRLQEMKKILFVALLLLINAISLAYSEKLEPGDDFYIETLDYRNGNAIIYGSGWIGNGDWSSSTLVIKNFKKKMEFQFLNVELAFKLLMIIAVLYILMLKMLEVIEVKHIEKQIHKYMKKDVLINN